VIGNKAMPSLGAAGFFSALQPFGSLFTSNLTNYVNTSLTEVSIDFNNWEQGEDVSRTNFT
jgi:hypothetical protein